jgi:hypothetical protein
MSSSASTSLSQAASGSISNDNQPNYAVYAIGAAVLILVTIFFLRKK